MPLNPAIVGHASKPLQHHVDARWTMAYAAALGDEDPRYFDTLATPAVLAHPVFPVCLEWPAILASREHTERGALTSAERGQAVHAAHDLHFYRPLRAGETLTTTATVIGLEQKRPGAYHVTRLDARNLQDELVCRSYQVTIFRGVEVSGGPVWCETPPALPAITAQAPQSQRVALPIPAQLAHIYTECARIWNPIHTDRAVAVAAGLPGIILHGTATLALAVSRIVRDYLAGDASRVVRLGGRFAAMVLLPSTVSLEITRQDASGVAFRALNENSEEAIRDGFLSWSKS